jgi:thiol:disulfide interchange protein DsbC
MEVRVNIVPQARAHRPQDRDVEPESPRSNARAAKQSGRALRAKRFERAIGIALCALAFGALPAVADERAIRNALAARIPDAQVIAIRKLPYAGLYEVAVRRGADTAIYYSDARGEIMIVGELIELRTDRNLTEERLRKLTAIEWNKLPFHWAITMRRGNGRREIAVFSDPNCPFCQKFERELATLDDITVHIFPWAVIKPESVRQAKSVWCSKDRVKAWNDLMLRRIEPTAPTDCDNPIEQLIVLGRRLGATSTPTWFLPNGEKRVGALPMSELVPLLDAARRH